MKKITILILFFLISFFSMGKSDYDGPIEIVAIEKAIVTNDIRLLGLLMDDWVTITVDNQANIYNKFQAQNIVKDILKFSGDKSFVMQKVGKSANNGGYFGIGTYKGKEKTHLLYFYLVYNKNRDNYLLKEIKID